MPDKQFAKETDPLATLQAENERLIALLESNRIDWRVAQEPLKLYSKIESPRLSTDAKLSLFRRLFRGGEFSLSPVR